MDKAETYDYDAVVVGSGFGGSVMFYRLAKEGLKVCLLERGQPFGPGDFPRSPLGMKNNFWDPSQNLFGMFDVWSFEGIDALISSGLGGGSLIYANVLLRKDEKWFVRENLNLGGIESWPITRKELESHYDNVEYILKPELYPIEHAPYNKTPKTVAFNEAAIKAGYEPLPTPLGITFTPPGKNKPLPGEPINEEVQNLHKRTRYTCRLVGECDIGCNYGSKNSLDYNYLTLASQFPSAEIKCLSEVRSFAPIYAENFEVQGYTIDYVNHNPIPETTRKQRRDTSQLPIHKLKTRQLILSAGTLGTTFLLLKNRAAFPNLSATLGTRFCGNGDFLGFATRCSTRQGKVRVPKVIDPGRGPVITSAFRVKDWEDGGQGRGFYIEDGGYPDLASWLVEVSGVLGTLKRLYIFILSRLAWFGKSPIETNIGAQIGRILGNCESSSGVLPMLGMGRDLPNGVMSLKGKLLEIDWKKKDSDFYYRQVRDTMAQLADVLGGELQDNPLSYFSRVITVHPLGGCPMGNSPEQGVVNPFGEVFGYRGFYIADGSVMPGPVGANPSLTIAALSDRFAERVIDTHYEFKRTGNY